MGNMSAFYISMRAHPTQGPLVEQHNLTQGSSHTAYRSALAVNFGA